jgi:hypothetical protein
MAAATPSLLRTVSDANRKLFGVGLHAINEMHVRFPDVPQSDMRLLWFGGGLQGQMPVLFALCPGIDFEIHTQKTAYPVSDELRDTVRVSYHRTSLEECLCGIEAYAGTQKFAVVLDFDFHIRPSELRARNKANVQPTVETESVHYDTYTRAYHAACARLARCGHVLVVSAPFRLPWFTLDFARNAHAATWLDPRLAAHELVYPDMLLCPQFASRAKSTELRGLLVAGAYSESVVDWQALDTSLNGTPTETRELARARFMLGQLETFQGVTARRAAVVEGDACMREWADEFIRNSAEELRQIVRGLESASSGTALYKEPAASECRPQASGAASA